MAKKQFGTDDIAHIAKLALITITPDEEKSLARAFNETIVVVDKLLMINVDRVSPTSQVTGLENVTREDVIDTKRMFTQDQALANAPRNHNGYFVVNQILNIT